MRSGVAQPGEGEGILLLSTTPCGKTFSFYYKPHHPALWKTFSNRMKSIFRCTRDEKWIFFHQLEPNLAKFSRKQGKLSVRLEQNTKPWSRTLATAK